MAEVRIETEAAEAAADALATATGSPVDQHILVPTVGVFPPAASAIAQLTALLDATETTIRTQRRAAAVELRAVAHEATAADV